MTKVFKIMNKDTGKFSKGGSDGGEKVWTKNGKSWGNIGHVKAHLNTYMYGRRDKYPYDNAVIIEVEFNPEDCYSIPVNDLFDEMVLSKEEQHRKEEERHKKWEEKKERELLAKLKAKYEK
ncbi:hypothetical protein PQE68_gp063 [Bacillus phage vB_BanS_Sophrita]|uniref:Uncharacterized protein n=1 Tax=Bacillus phage vB_BanS_Sophrita TaxID=2894790 RepID=A0AAE9CDT0_9CAUD|nr:hypothetical protein PQE68_gp063 [Bacillus phage vB_BanS_Sophrita]UGO50654.1 hypothetical protein SOPHRITA_63 [Bacillus phage vB_BanS_Sophrita]